MSPLVFVCQLYVNSRYMQLSLRTNIHIPPLTIEMKTQNILGIITTLSVVGAALIVASITRLVYGVVNGFSISSVVLCCKTRSSSNM